MRYNALKAITPTVRVVQNCSNEVQSPQGHRTYKAHGSKMLKWGTKPSRPSHIRRKCFKGINEVQKDFLHLVCMLQKASMRCKSLKTIAHTAYMLRKASTVSSANSSWSRICRNFSIRTSAQSEWSQNAQTCRKRLPSFQETLKMRHRWIVAIRADLGIAQPAI